MKVANDTPLRQGKKREEENVCREEIDRPFY